MSVAKVAARLPDLATVKAWSQSLAMLDAIQARIEAEAIERALRSTTGPQEQQSAKPPRR